MDFTRQPIIESVITPKEGCKLVVRSSKSTGQEEYFVDALELVSFGQALFFRSLERPKAFLVPVSDYEVLEVREARMVLKNVGIERTIKIGGGKESSQKQQQREQQQQQQREQQQQQASEPTVKQEESEVTEAVAEVKQEQRLEKRRDKRRQSRRRRNEGGAEEAEGAEGARPIAAQVTERAVGNGGFTPTIIPPPPTLISETIARYKDNAMFKGAFYVKEPAAEEAAGETAAPAEENVASPEDIVEALEMQNVSLEPSEYGYLGFLEEHDAWRVRLPEEESSVLKEENLDASEGAPPAENGKL